MSRILLVTFNTWSCHISSIIHRRTFIICWRSTDWYQWHVLQVSYQCLWVHHRHWMDGRHFINICVVSDCKIDSHDLLDEPFACGRAVKWMWHVQHYRIVYTSWILSVFYHQIMALWWGYLVSLVQVGYESQTNTLMITLTKKYGKPGPLAACPTTRSQDIICPCCMHNQAHCSKDTLLWSCFGVEETVGEEVICTLA